VNLFISHSEEIFNLYTDIPATEIEPSIEEKINKDYADYALATIAGKEYRLHPKLTHKYNIPEIDRATLKEWKNRYDCSKEIEALKILGFDCTKNRKQGIDYVKETELFDGTVVLEPKWITLPEASIRRKQSIYFKGDKECFGPVISLTGGKNSSLYRQRFAGYNKCIPRNVKYKAFPRYIAENINRYNNKVVGLNQHSNTRTIMFDIDNHNYLEEESGMIEADRQLNLLMKKLDFPEIAMIEQSYMGGYHLAILTNDYVSDNDLSHFVKQFNTQNCCSIEARTTQKLFRIPGHFSYTLGKLIYVNSQAVFTPFPAEQAYDMYLEQVFEAEKSDYRLEYGIIEPHHKHRQFANTGSNIYSRRKSTEQIYTSLEHALTSEFKLSQGKRDYNSYAIAVHMVRQGASVDQLFNALNAAHTTSRDWSKWSYFERYQEAIRLHANASRNIGSYLIAEPVKTDMFISSAGYVPQIILDLLADDKVVEKLAPVKPTSYAKNRARIIADTRICLIEIVGRMLYECDHPRQAYKVSLEDKAKLEAGFQFPRKGQELLAKKCGIRNVKGIYRHILHAGILLNQCNGYKYKTHINDTSYCEQFFPVGTAPDCKDSDKIIEAIIAVLEFQRASPESAADLTTNTINGITMCQVLNAGQQVDEKNNVSSDVVLEKSYQYGDTKNINAPPVIH